MCTFNEAVTDIANDIRESSPVIAIAFGVGALIASSIASAVAMKKSEDILDSHRDLILEIKEAKENKAIDEKTASKEIGKAYMRTVGKLALKFAPALALTLLGISLIGTGYSIEHGRLLDTKDQLACTTATLAATVADFKGYRERARARFGEEVDNELMYDIRRETVEETITDAKGREKTVKKEVVRTGDIGEPGYGIYAKWFNKDSCNGWVNNAEMNRYYIQDVEDVLNKRLNVEGVLTVNDVYEEIGLKDELDQPIKTKAGQVMGWINDPSKVHQIVLGVHEPINADFVNGNTPDCLICPIPEDNVWELLND